MEYCGCGDLAAKVDRYKRRKAYIDEDVIWRYLIQCLKALTGLHENGICHRDIKTANTFLGEDGSVKIGDMNVSKRLKRGQLQTQIGTPYYMSPEIWHNRPYDASSDMWALGCMVYELCALRPPFLGDSFPALKRAVATGRYSPAPKKYSDGIHKVIRHMLRLKPKDRPGAAELLSYPEVMAKLHLDGTHEVGHDEVPSLPDMMATMVVPRNMRKLGGLLPKPCYPDVRPNSPSAWTAAEQGVENKKPTHRAAPPPPPAVAGKENEQPRRSSRNAPPPPSSKEDKASKLNFPVKPPVDNRAQVLREVAANNAANAAANAAEGPETDNAPRRPHPPVPQTRAAVKAAPPTAAYMPQYQGQYHPPGYVPSSNAQGAYHRGRYKPANLVPASNAPSRRIW
jgi:serine/threonine protein kinase